MGLGLGAGVGRFYSLSRDGDSGTFGELIKRNGEWVFSFYSLSRDGDSGTGQSYCITQLVVVSIRCREMGTAERPEDGMGSPISVSIRCREMGTAERA